jgi:hypothetical protein
MLLPASLAILLALQGSVVSASIAGNLAYNSPSFRAPQLGHDRRAIQRNHKRWEYYDGQVSFPYNVASGDPCTSLRSPAVTAHVDKQCPRA